MRKLLLSMLPLAIVVVLTLLSFGVVSARGVASTKTAIPRLALCQDAYEFYCHGRAEANTTGYNFNGIQSNDSVRGLGAGVNGFVSNTVWIYDDHTSPGNDYWVEAGYGIGFNNFNPPECGGSTSESFFWTDSRPLNGSTDFHMHCPEVVGSGDYGFDVQDSIFNDGTNSFKVRITPHSSSQISQDSTSNAMFPNHAFFGENIFEGDESGPATVFNHNEYLSQNNQWFFWSGSTWQLTIDAHQPPYAFWVQTPSQNSTGGKLKACTTGLSCP